MDSYDAVVVGAGLAGLETARLLGERGLRVLLADRKAAVDRAIHTTGIFVRSTFEDFAFPPECLGPPVRRVVLYSPARRSLALESRQPEFRVGRMGLLYRLWLERCVRAGVEWSPETIYLSGAPCSGGAILKLLRSGRAAPVRARFVVGADGARSRVARDLELDRNRRWIAGLEEVLLGAPHGGPPAFHVFLDPALAPGYIAWVVNDGEEAHVGVGGYLGCFDPQRALESFRAGLRGVFDLGAAQVVERRGGLIPVGGVLRRLACPSGLLVGDAAGAPSPLTAGGLDPCLRLSAFAASVIDHHLASGDPRALAAYSGDRFRARFISRLWMRGAMDRIRHPLLLELAFAALRAPPLRALARHIFFGRGSFPDIPIRTPAPASLPQDAAGAP